MTVAEEDSIEELDDLLEEFDDEVVPAAIIVPAPKILRRDKLIIQSDENDSDDPDYEESSGSKSSKTKTGKHSKGGGGGGRCGQCNLLFNSKHELRFHVNTTHKPRLDHECEKCGASFHRIANLRRHFKTVHENQRDFKCGHCERLFGEKQTLQRHIRDIHNAKQVTEIEFERVDDVEDENGEGHSVLVFVKQGKGPRKSIPEEFMNKYRGTPGRTPKTPTPVLVDINRKRKSRAVGEKENHVSPPTSQIQIINISPGFGFSAFGSSATSHSVSKSNIKLINTTTTTAPVPTKVKINPAPIGHLKKKVIEFDPTKSPEYALATAKIYDFYSPPSSITSKVVEEPKNQLLEMIIPITKNRKTSGDDTNSESSKSGANSMKNKLKSKVTIDNLSPTDKCEKCKKLIDTKYGLMNFKALCLECLKSILPSITV